MSKPVDAETHVATSKVLAEARRRGVDPVEALHQAGFLVTPAGDEEIRLRAVRSVLVQFERHRPADFLQRKYPNDRLEQRTIQDLYNAILDWLEGMARDNT